MKILKVDKPLQDANTVEPQYGERDSYPTWCVRTERESQRRGGIQRWLNDKEAFINSHPELEGIYLYAIIGMLQHDMGRNEKDLCFYIRYDYIRKK